MKRILLLPFLMLTFFPMYAQNYTVISRSNDTIRLFPNKVGDTFKSLLPGGKSEKDAEYRLIRKEVSEKETLLFVEFPRQSDKFLVTYEIDLQIPDSWEVNIYTLKNLFESVKRENAILLKGYFLGLKIDIHERPINFQDIICIDGLEFASPIKISVLESTIAKEVAAIKEKEVAELKEREAITSSKDKDLLTEQDIEEAKKRPNDFYIAYLLSASIYNYQIDRSLLVEITDTQYTTNLIKSKKYSTNQLYILSNGYDTRLEKYKK